MVEIPQTTAFIHDPGVLFEHRGLKFNLWHVFQVSLLQMGIFKMSICPVSVPKKEAFRGIPKRQSLRYWTLSVLQTILAGISNPGDWLHRQGQGQGQGPGHDQVEK